MKVTHCLGAAALAAAAGAVSGQIAPIGPFTGTAQETFEVIGQWPPAGPCIFCPSVPGAFGGICTLESDDPVNGSSIHVTGGWGYVCSIGPHATPRLSASPGGAYNYHFSPGNEAGQFGGYFGTNCGVPDGTVEFYDITGALIGTQPITYPADCSWTWQGWQSTVPISKVRILGNGPGQGYVMMDDMEYMPGYTGPTGACCIPATLACAITNATACATFGGTYHGDGSTCAAANCPTPGACCLTDGSCVQATAAGCSAQSGVYRGDSTACATANCPQPPTGACCNPSTGACTVLTQAQCTAAAGIYRGDNVTCAAANCPQPPFVMNCNAQGTFIDISATGTQITSGDDVTGPFTSSVTNALVTNPNLYACTNGFISDSATYQNYVNGTLPVSGLGFGLFPDWNDLYVDGTTGFLLHQAVVENGVNVEVIEWYNVTDCCGGGPTGSFEVKIYGPGGPALVQFLYQDMSWDGNGGSSTQGFQWSAGGAYAASLNAPNIASNSVCSIVASGPTCYPNCDHSTTAPCLNVADFTCFLNSFANGSSYANCDNSTTPPVLNVGDFTCFLNSFATGCGTNC